MKNRNNICNCCGQKIGQEDYVHIEKLWGYFSNGKDGERHCINICESCYDRWIKDFKYAPDIEEERELI